MKASIIIGTRGSNLALKQTEIVAEEIQKKRPEKKIIIKKIQTKGDILINTSTQKLTDKGFFVSEIQDQLRF